jgi:glyoxylase-like metal-dependent hydrolase (beta-lactamase superfamily II)
MVLRWDVVTIGNLSRNRYWGESEEQAVRPALCTCTLVTGADFRLLVDPSCEEREVMAAELSRRTGLALEDVDAVFLTHQHGDHHAGLAHFPHATWLAAAEVAALVNDSGDYGKQIEHAPRMLFEAVEVVPTPGHTLGHHSLRFTCDGLSVVVAGDAVMTRDYFADRRGFFNSQDFDLAARTIEELASVADLLVPGHDNYFLVRRP